MYSFSTYSKAYYFRSKMCCPVDYVIYPSGSLYYVIHKDSLDDFVFECGL